MLKLAGFNSTIYSFNKKTGVSFTPNGESPLEARLRNLRQETQKFNQDWWTDHNKQFKQGRESFIKNILETKYPNEPEKSTLSADEMSQFYRFGMASSSFYPSLDMF